MRPPVIIKMFILHTAIIVLIAGCDRTKPGRPANDPSTYRESLINANKEAVLEENGQIDDFVSRHQWEMERTSTGLRIMKTKKGIGAMAQSGMTVTLSYTLTNLDGDTIYTALEDGPLVFRVGKGQVISGLEEAILLLKVGDRAKIIIPSHLAYGLIGDQKKIRHKATLVYDVEFISMY
jgi:FKBP-type peptidyl-prolyl cis-trans isomerase